MHSSMEKNWSAHVRQLFFFFFFLFYIHIKQNTHTLERGENVRTLTRPSIRDSQLRENFRAWRCSSFCVSWASHVYRKRVLTSLTRREKCCGLSAEIDGREGITNNEFWFDDDSSTFSVRCVLMSFEDKMSWRFFLYANLFRSFFAV